jgi:hypothetical protein
MLPFGGCVFKLMSEDLQCGCKLQGLRETTCKEMASRKKSIATCSTCKHALQAIATPPEIGDDLYCMSLSLMPTIIKVGRSKCPTQRAIELQTSMPFWVFPSIVWLKRGEDETRVHERLRPYRIENAPSREYFKLPLKRGSDLVEQVLYSAAADSHSTSGSVASGADGEAEGQKHLAPTNSSKRRKLVMCAQCQKIQATVSDVHTSSPAEHLFLVSAPFCPEMVGILRSSDPHHLVRDLQEELPGNLELRTIWYGQGHRHGDIHRNLKSLRADCPGGNWFHLTPQPASAVISKLLFGSLDDDDDEVEPGITLLTVDV